MTRLLGEQRVDKKKGMMVVLSGFSGSGKNYIRNRLIEKYPDDYVTLVSATTREMRKGEAEGVEYYFKTREDFTALTSQGAFLEWQPYADNMYGVLREEFEHKTSGGKSAILIMETTGALYLQKKYKALAVFVSQVDAVEASKKSLNKRGAEDKEVLVRFNEMKKSSADLEFFDYVVLNEFNTDEAVDQIHNIIQANKQRVSENMSFVWQLQMNVAEELGGK